MEEKDSFEQQALARVTAFNSIQEDESRLVKEKGLKNWITLGTKSSDVLFACKIYEQKTNFTFSKRLITPVFFANGFIIQKGSKTKMVYDCYTTMCYLMCYFMIPYNIAFGLPDSPRLQR